MVTLTALRFSPPLLSFSQWEFQKQSIFNTNALSLPGFYSTTCWLGFTHIHVPLRCTFPKRASLVHAGNWSRSHFVFFCVSTLEVLSSTTWQTHLPHSTVFLSWKFPSLPLLSWCHSCPALALRSYSASPQHASLQAGRISVWRINLWGTMSSEPRWQRQTVFSCCNKHFVAD